MHAFYYCYTEHVILHSTGCEAFGFFPVGDLESLRSVSVKISLPGSNRVFGNALEEAGVGQGAAVHVITYFYAHLVFWPTTRMATCFPRWMSHWAGSVADLAGEDTNISHWAIHPYLLCLKVSSGVSFWMCPYLHSMTQEIRNVLWVLFMVHVKAQGQHLRKLPSYSCSMDWAPLTICTFVHVVVLMVAHLRDQCPQSSVECPFLYPTSSLYHRFYSLVHHIVTILFTILPYWQAQLHNTVIDVISKSVQIIS